MTQSRGGYGVGLHLQGPPGAQTRVTSHDGMSEAFSLSVPEPLAQFPSEPLGTRSGYLKWLLWNSTGPSQRRGKPIPGMFLGRCVH